MGKSRRDLAEMPKPVRYSFGIRLNDLQEGRKAHDSKALPEIGAGVLELREAYDGNAYRLMYVLKLKKAIYVLHVFMKKSTSGIGLPKPDANLIEARLKLAQKLDMDA
jgi:phage-related protein